MALGSKLLLEAEFVFYPNIYMFLGIHISGFSEKLRKSSSMLVLLGLLGMNSCKEGGKESETKQKANAPRSKPNNGSIENRTGDTVPGRDVDDAPPVAPLHADSKMQNELNLLFQSYSGEDLKDKIGERITSIDASNWREMLQLINLIPPGEYVGRAFGSVQHRLIHEHPELWPDEFETFKQALTTRQLESLALNYGDKLADGEADKHKILEDTLARTKDSESVRLAFLRSFIGSWAESDSSGAVEAVFGITEIRALSRALTAIGRTGDAQLISQRLVNEAPRLSSSSQDWKQSAQDIGGFYADNRFAPPESLLKHMDVESQGIALATFFNRQAERDLNSTLTQVGALPNGAVKDEVVFGLLSKINEYDPKIAREWIDQIANPEFKKMAIQIYMKQN